MHTLQDTLLQLRALMFVAGAFAFMVGARSTASKLLVAALAGVLVQALLPAAPCWLLVILLGYVLFLLPFVAARVLATLVSPAIGKRAANHAAGIWAAHLGEAMLVKAVAVFTAGSIAVLNFWHWMVESLDQD